MSITTTKVSDFYKIESDPENDILRAEWLRSVNKEEMIAGGTMLYQVLKDTGITRVMANGQRLVLLDSDTKSWMSNNFYVLLSQTSLRKLARVLPSNLFSKLALESVATRADALSTTRFVYRNFDTENKAMEWLLESE